MLEDPNIRDLIAWSADGEGFLMSPSADFAKVLSSVPPASPIVPRPEADPHPGNTSSTPMYHPLSGSSICTDSTKVSDLPVRSACDVQAWY